MTRLVAETDIALADAEAIVGPVCEHLAEHGAAVDRDGDAWILTWPQARARLRADGGRLTARAEADDRESLYLLRFGIASHVMEFAGEPSPSIAWSGDGRDIVTPPNFRMATVAAVTEVTPHLRRVTLAGEDFERFMTDEALHVKFIVPLRKGEAVTSPSIGPDGLVVWSKDGKDTSVRRTYTVRRYDRRAGAIDVDVVLHDDPGPGARWALDASPGDEIGVTGPGGGGVPRADQILLAGDETALPAISRILETAPPAVRGTAIIEIGGEDDQQSHIRPDGVELIWLRRDRGDPSLADMVESTPFANGSTSRFLWAGCEFDDFKRIRAHARKTLGLTKAEHLVVAYWRRGSAESEPK